MQKVFSLKPSDLKSVHELQSILDDGYKVIYVTANHIAIAGGGDSVNTYSIEGHIVYILQQ